MPYDLLESIEILANASRALAEHCIEGIRADRERCRAYAERSPASATALAPIIGYDATAALVKQALAQGGSIRDALRASNLAPPERLDEVLDLVELTRGGRVAV